MSPLLVGLVGVANVPLGGWVQLFAVIVGVVFGRRRYFDVVLIISGFSKRLLWLLVLSLVCCAGCVVLGNVLSCF